MHYAKFSASELKPRSSNGYHTSTETLNSASFLRHYVKHCCVNSELTVYINIVISLFCSTCFALTYLQLADSDWFIQVLKKRKFHHGDFIHLKFENTFVFEMYLKKRNSKLFSMASN